MGVDAEFLVKIPVSISDGQLAALQESVRARFEDGDGDYPELRRAFPDADFAGWGLSPKAEGHFVRVSMLDRYFGPHCLRGYWPRLRDLGEFLVDLFGQEAEVRYGSDSVDAWSFFCSWDEVKVVNDHEWAVLGAG